MFTTKAWQFSTDDVSQSWQRNIVSVIAWVKLTLNDPLDLKKKRNYSLNWTHDKYCGFGVTDKLPQEWLAVKYHRKCSLSVFSTPIILRK